MGGKGRSRGWERGVESEDERKKKKREGGERERPKVSKQDRVRRERARKWARAAKGLCGGVLR